MLAFTGARFPAVQDLADEFERIVDDRGEILDTASTRLGEIRSSIDLAEGVVRAAVARVLSDDRVRRCLQTPEPSWRHGRPVLQVKAEQRSRIPGVLHDRSASGATVFVEPEGVVEAANRLADVRADEHRELQVIMTQACRALRRRQPEIEAAVTGMTALDLGMARAHLIHSDGWRAVEVTEDGPLCLRGAVHPILLRVAASRVGDGLVPLDLTLGDPHRMLVVTGPNTGGKTVVLKTVGLLSLMAMSGGP